MAHACVVDRAGRLVAVWAAMAPAGLPPPIAPPPPHALAQGLSGTMAMDHAVRTVVRVCQARLFRLPIFPRACLRQALALYYVLTALGYPATIHFGARKGDEALHGHSWVTIRGMSVA